MPFPLKIQPLDFSSPGGPAFLRPVVKSRLKKLLERPFSNVLRITGPEKAVTDEFEPSSFCLGNMVKSFIEEGVEKQQKKCSKTKCYCNTTSKSDDKFDSRRISVCKDLKKLVMCTSVSERNLLADSAKIFEKNELFKCRFDQALKSVTEGLIALGYDASICKSRWGKAPTYPAGEHEYIDVIKEGERLIVDIDFRAEFEIARAGCTKMYNAILQVLPRIFVGKADRLEDIVCLVSNAAKVSLRNNRMPFPPWRTADYVKSKWLSPYTRIAPAPAAPAPAPAAAAHQQQSVTLPSVTVKDSSDLANDIENLVIETEKMATSPVIAGVKSPASSDDSDTVSSMSEDDEAE